MPKSSPANFAFYPLLWLAICFAAGILTAKIFNFRWQISLSVCCLCTVFSIVFIRRKFASIFVFISFIAVGALHFQIENQLAAPNRLKKIYDENRIISGDPLEVEGVLQNKPELAVGGFFLVLQTEKAIYKNSEIPVSGNIRFFAPISDDVDKTEYESFNLDYGSKIRVACRLRRADDFLNPGAVSRKELLDQKETDATGIIKSPLLVEKIGEAESFAPLGWIYDWRQNLIVAFRDKFNVSTAGVLIASLLGNDNFVDKTTAEAFRAGGTFHVLVISGLHITFIGGLTLLFVRIFTRQRWWQFFITAIFLWIYALAVGANVPVVRAALMFTILLFSQAIYRTGTLLNALGLCALILLVWRPNDIFTSSFQLTFTSVAAIVAMAFPLIEKLRAVGSWSPSVAAPFPPNVPIWLKRFCEMLYWREIVWEKEVSRQLWSANLFKSPYLKKRIGETAQGIARFVFEAVLVSMIAQAWMLPLLIVYFHRFAPVSVLANLWVGIIIALESFAAVFALVCASISDALALPLIKLTEFLNWLIVSAPNFFIENSWSNWRLPHYAGAFKAIYIAYFAPLVFLIFVLHFWNPFALDLKTESSNRRFLTAPLTRIASILFLLLFGIIVFHPFSAPISDGRLHIDFLDVGQGDAALIRFPNGETLLVDGGGKIGNRIAVENEYQDEPEIFEPDTQTIGEMVVSNFLWEKGFSQIDYILATHADADHIEGLSDAAKNFQPRAAIFGRTPSKDAEYAALHSILERRGIESVKLSRGDILTFGDAKIEILYPETDENAEAVSDNNHSLVLRVKFGDRKFLLTGDIEKETENFLIDQPEFLQSDVIKVAHHGSRTSSTQEFVNAARAKLAIISVGKESPFGHPNAEVVERWKNAGAKVLTTGENGTISVSTDGRDLQLQTFNREKIYR